MSRQVFIRTWFALTLTSVFTSQTYAGVNVVIAPAVVPTPIPAQLAPIPARVNPTLTPDTTISVSPPGTVVIPPPGGDVVMVAPMAPPALIVEVIPVMPYPDGIWVAGYWGWIGERYIWVQGRWDHRRFGHEWVPHRWVAVNGQWHLQGGGWHPTGRGGHAPRGEGWHEHHGR
ncbi:MAG: hypothetical protein IT497_02110 [Ottowia sp.]|nr:hypothetical protein [Ottowia sp.]